MDLNTIKNTGNWGSSSSRLNENFSKVGLEVDKLKYAAYNSKLYPSAAALRSAIPSPKVGDWAIVGDTIPGEIYQCTTDGVWTATGKTGGGYGMEVTEKHVTEQYLTEVHNEYIGDIVNHPDDEDLVSVDDIEGKGVLKFNNKAYNAASFSGLGRVYLRKNIVGGKNVLDSTMIPSIGINTRFIVQYDYDLNGETLTIPEGCTLDFQGGSFKNGTIKGNNTRIRSVSNNIFRNVSISGTFDIAEIYLSWFELSSTDNLACLMNAIRLAHADRTNVIHIEGRIGVKLTASMPHISLPSNTRIEGGIIYLISSNLSSTNSIFETNQGDENIEFKGIILYGDAKSNQNANNVDIAVGHGIRVNGGKNISVVQCSIYEFMGDGINVQTGSAGVEETVPEHVRISRCICNNNRRLGIALEGGKDILISDTQCSGNGMITVGCFPGAGIDIEPWHKDNYVEDVQISNCNLLGNRYNSLCVYPVNSARTKGIVIDGVSVDSILTRGNGNRIIFKNVNVKSNISLRSSIVDFDNCRIDGLINIIEDNLPCDTTFTGCHIDINGDDCKSNNYSIVRIGKVATSSAGIDLQNKLLFQNCNISVDGVSNCYRLTSQIKGAGECITKLHKCDIDVKSNINVTEYISEIFDCVVNVNSNALVIKNSNASSPLTIRKTILKSTRDKMLIIGNASIVGQLNPYDVVLDGCSVNPDKVYADGTSIDTLFDLGYIPSTKSYSVLFRDMKFPKGISHNTAALQVSKYYNLDWIENGSDMCRSGKIDSRPVKNILPGFQYFDTTLWKPIWWTGTKWVDSTGKEV